MKCLPTIFLLIILILSSCANHQITKESETATPSDVYVERAIELTNENLPKIYDTLTQTKLTIMGEVHNIHEYEKFIAEAIPDLHQRGLRNVIFERGIIDGYLDNYMVHGFFKLPETETPIIKAIAKLNEKLRSEGQENDQIRVAGMNFDDGKNWGTFLKVWHQIGLNKQINGTPEEVLEQLDKNDHSLTPDQEGVLRYYINKLLLGQQKANVIWSQEREDFMASNVADMLPAIKDGYNVLVLTGGQHAQKDNFIDEVRKSFVPMTEQLIKEFPNDIYSTYFFIYRGEIPNNNIPAGKSGTIKYEKKSSNMDTELLTRLENAFDDQELFINLKEHDDWPEVQIAMIEGNYSVDLSKYFDGIIIFPTVTLTER